MFWWLDSQDVDLDCLNSKNLLMSGLEVPNSTNVEQLEDGSTELNSLVGSWFSIDWQLTKGQETDTYGVRYVSVWRQPRTQHYRSWYFSLAWCRMAVSWWSRASNQRFPIQNLENVLTLKTILWLKFIQTPSATFHGRWTAENIYMLIRLSRSMFVTHLFGLHKICLQAILLYRKWKKWTHVGLKIYYFCVLGLLFHVIQIRYNKNHISQNHMTYTKHTHTNTIKKR
jgi:hypothetical protein